MKRPSLVALCSPFLLAAQMPMLQAPPHTVRALGSATVTAKPDQVRISVGITTQAATAEDAVSEDASKTEAVLSNLKSLLGTSGTLQTTNYSVSPQYKYEPGQPPTITGYEASHTVDVTLNDLSRAGKVIDGASKAGANGINRVEFTIKNDAALREQAIAKATGVARANAEAIAKALGLTVTGVYSAETTESNSIHPIMAPMAKTMMAQSTPTQLESGSVEVQASVTVWLAVK